MNSGQLRNKSNCGQIEIRTRIPESELDELTSRSYCLTKIDDEAVQDKNFLINFLWMHALFC